MSENNDFGAFIAGVIVGGLTGAAIALLMAPQSGKEVRGAIREKSIELRDRANETVEQARARAEKAIEETQSQAETAIEEMRKRVEELSETVRERSADLQKRITPAAESAPAEIQMDSGEAAAEA
ncbi:MAG: YtxH domain-containing protein [Anaerolineales bacterium]